MCNLYFAVYGQTYVFDHLSGGQCDGKHALYFLGISGDRFCRERPQSDGTEQAELDAFRTCYFHHLLADTGRRTESDQQIFGILALELFGADFSFFDLPIFSLEADVVLLHVCRVQLQ